MIPSDHELVEKAKSGDKGAFTELFHRYRKKIFGYLSRYISNNETAEDLTVETFWNAYNNILSYQATGTFSSWLYAIATNCARREVQRRERRNEISLEEPLRDGLEGLKLGDTIADENAKPEYEARKKELKSYVYRIVGNFKKKYKDPILLCDVEGLSYDEAAEVMKCNAKTVGTRLRRGRKTLYGILKKYGYNLNM